LTNGNTITIMKYIQYFPIYAYSMAEKSLYQPL
jgi:hypothetical protein